MLGKLVSAALVRPTVVGEAADDWVPSVDSTAVVAIGVVDSEIDGDVPELESKTENQQRRGSKPSKVQSFEKVRMPNRSHSYRLCNAKGTNGVLSSLRRQKETDRFKLFYVKTKIQFLCMRYNQLYRFVVDGIFEAGVNVPFALEPKDRQNNK